MIRKKVASNAGYDQLITKMDPLMEHLSPRQRAEEWIESFRELDQEPAMWPTTLGEAARLAAEKGLTVGQMVTVRKRQPVSLYEFLYTHLFRCGVDRDQAKREIVSSFEEHGVKSGPVIESKKRMPDVVWVPRQGFFSQDVDGDYSHKPTELLNDILEDSGMSIARKDGFQPEISRFRSQVCQQRKALWAGELAGHKVGLTDVCGKRVLITRSFKLIKPGAGDWSIVQNILRQTFGDKQLPYFYAVLKLFYEALRDGTNRPGQMMILCGPVDCWKSFVQHHIITPVWGGRSADASSFLTNKTEFNSELVGAEHLFLDDAKPYSNWLSRHDFSESLKNMIVGKVLRVHGKGKDAVNLAARQRITMSLNDDANALKCMPDISESFADKAHIFRCFSHTKPLQNTTDNERKELDTKVACALPGFIGSLVNSKIPADIVGQRFGVKEHHDETLLERLYELSDESRLSDLIDELLLEECYEPDAIRYAEEIGLETPSIWVGSASHLQFELTRDRRTAERARELLSWENATGTLLGKLSAKRPQKCSLWRHKVKGKVVRDWIIAIKSRHR